MYRHSLFFLEHEKATVAREYVEGTLDGLDGLKAEDTDIL